MNAYFTELQMKSYLFESSPYFERVEFGVGAEFNYGIRLKNDWGIQIGFNYFTQNFKNRFTYNLAIQNPNNELVSSEQYTFTFNTSLIQYDVSFLMTINHENCEEVLPRYSDGRTLEMTLLRENKIN
ncbi:MAG: hypothetical protein ACI8YQ_004088 [Polaribacter sp.]